ncbi:MAG TPA: inositol monophosphatase family protein [Gemmatimonadaceae bacterium]|nr:inositol monophosphatase family protein [Gemmatimonadaceae bacterium]
MSTPHTGQRTRGAATELLEIATTAASRAAALIRQRAGEVATLEWRKKGPADFVSAVDTASEQLIRDLLTRELPDAVMLGEEMSPGAAVDAGTAFIVDPLDGTTNFLHGYPWYAVSIAALCGGDLTAGVIVNVPTGDVYTATSGGGATRNGEPLSVSTIADPALSLVGTGFPFKDLRQLERYQQQFAAVTRATSGIRRAGSAALDLADVAGGRLDAFWELQLAPWDFAAGVLLIREAGGLVTDVTGAPVPFTPSSIVAGNPVMHAWLLRALNQP